MLVASIVEADGMETKSRKFNFTLMKVFRAFNLNDWVFDFFFTSPIGRFICSIPSFWYFSNFFPFWSTIAFILYDSMPDYTCIPNGRNGIVDLTPPLTRSKGKLDGARCDVGVPCGVRFGTRVTCCTHAEEKYMLSSLDWLLERGDGRKLLHC